MGWVQLPLWTGFPPRDEPTFNCAECGKQIGEDEYTSSLWSCCKDCENARLEDMWAG